MKKLLTLLTLVLIALTVRAEVIYSFDAMNSPVGSSKLETKGATLAVASGSKDFQSAKQNTIKYSNNSQYKVTLPNTAKVTKIVFYGYGNEDDKFTYLKELAGKEYDESAYKFKARTDYSDLNSAKFQTYTIDFATPLTNSFTFTFSNAQAAVTIAIYSDEQASQGSQDDNSRGKYNNPATGGVTPTGASKVFSWGTPASQMEKLTRGLVALPEMNGKGNVLTWRLMGNEGLGVMQQVKFDIYRNGACIASDRTLNNFTDADGNASDTYYIKVKKDGAEVETSETVARWSRIYKTVKLDRPATDATTKATYTPNDMSAADLDGDGNYELIVKWDPNNSKDNSQSGITGNVLIDAYKMDGTKLWRIDLGRNIRAGAHYTQFMVYDFDGDGKAELMCKTAPNSRDGAGEYVNQATDDENIKKANNTKSWLTSSGYVDGGQEYLTVFDGVTGKAINTIAYNPNRNAKSELSEAQGTFNWAVGKTDNHGYNRGERYLAAVAYLDGPDSNASAIFCRGYYAYAYIWAVDFDGSRLIPRWLHRSDADNKYSVVTYDAAGNGTSKSYTPGATTSGGGSKTMFGNGNHNMTIADVDGDGRDEIIWGSASLDNDGTLLYATGFGHGDAIHLGKMIPDSEGLQVFQVHEEKGTYAWDLHDAATGEILLKNGPAGIDNGRGMAADVMASNRGYEFWSGADSNVRACAGGATLGSKRPAVNFRIYWDGDLQDEMFDGHLNSGNGQCAAAIEKLVSTSSNVTLLSLSKEEYGSGQSCNWTKATPCLQADIIGDWREELILWDLNDPSIINIYSSNVPTTYAIPTLMHDHTYRMAVAWQNTAYNQPPHLGIYLPDMFDRDYGINSQAYKDANTKPVDPETGISNATTAPAASSQGIYTISGIPVQSIQAPGIYVVNGKKVVK